MTTGDAGKGLQRYEATYENIEKDDDGDFVLYADYMELFVERNSLKQQLSDLQQRVRELEGELEAEKSNDHWLGEDA